MKEFDLLLHSLQHIVKENVYVEDGELYIKSKCKYDLWNLLEKVDKKFINRLKKELEYEG